MSIYNTLVNKAKTFRLYFNKFLFNLDLDDSGDKDFSTYNTAFKLTIMAVYISSTLVIYTKIWYIGLSKCLGWVPFFYIKVIPGLYLAYIQDLT
jgi:hypothetical protein